MTDVVSQLRALADLTAKGLLTAEDAQARKFALVSQLLEGASHAGIMSQLGILADLSAQDLLTDEEFQTKKKELVRRLSLETD